MPMAAALGQRGSPIFHAGSLAGLRHGVAGLTNKTGNLTGKKGEVQSVVWSNPLTQEDVLNLSASQPHSRFSNTKPVALKLSPGDLTKPRGPQPSPT